ncbi:GPP34 family phosphoprotein [Kitasatospora sp. NPDC093550]|uniref:GOLPH3/VPS74 family protein n=1 Tax=Kitasatospora sp. NPDC093550 TaxID=3364089 RepID=UPI003803C8E9
MTPSDVLRLPEELVLLCAHPTHGRFRHPAGEFHHVVAGAVLAELLLDGAISVEKHHITGYQPFGARDEVAAGVLTRLEARGKSRFRPGLDQAIARIPNPPGHRYYLDHLTAEGYFTVEEKRFLGLPWHLHRLVRPEVRTWIAARAATTLRDPDGALGRPTAARDRQLAGLIGVASLEHRLHPGRDGAPGQARRPEADPGPARPAGGPAAQHFQRLSPGHGSPALPGRERVSAPLGGCRGRLSG